MTAVRRHVSAVLAVLALALGVFLAAIFFGRFEPARTVLIRLARPLAATSLVLLASLSCGVAAASATRKVIAKVARLPDSQPRTTIAALPECLFVGIPIYGTLMAAIALTGAPLQLAAILVTLLLAVGGGLVLRLRRPALSVSWSAWDIALLGPPIAIAVLGAATPVASPDELVYKLAVPHAYWLHGGMVELPLNSHSYFPAGFGMGSLGALVLSGGVGAKLVHLALYFLTLRTIRRLGDRLDPPAGLWGSVVVAWTPALMLVAGWGWPDWGVIGLLLLSYERWRSFREGGGAGDVALSMLALSGALAARYTAVLWLVGFAVVVALHRMKRSQPVARLVVVMASVLIVVGGFFYVRNLLWTGSPVAPFLLPDSPSVDRFRGESGSGWVALLSGQDILHPDIVDDSLGILLPLSVLLSPLSLGGRGRSFADLFGLGLAQLAVFATLAPLSRLWMTALVPLALLGASVTVRLWREAGRALATLLSVGAAVALSGQLLLVGYVFAVSYDLGAYLVGGESEVRYRFRTREFAAPYEWIARSTPLESLIFLIGENRTFDLARPAFSAGNLDGPRLSKYLARFPTADAFSREMRRLAVTHLLLHRAWYRVRDARPVRPLGMLEKEYIVEVGPETDAMLAEFLASRARLRFRDGAYEIYEVAP